MPVDPAWTQPEPLLVIAAMELADAAGRPSATSLAAAERLLERVPAGGEIPARLAAALIRLTLSRRTGDLDAAAAAAASAEDLLGQLPEGLLARHPGIRAQVLSGRGAAELRAGRLDEAVVIFRAAAAADPESTSERAEALGYLALAEALRGRLSRAVKLAGEADAAIQSGSHGLAAHVTPAAAVALASRAHRTATSYGRRIAS